MCAGKGTGRNEVVDQQDNAAARKVDAPYLHDEKLAENENSQRDDLPDEYPHHVDIEHVWSRGPQDDEQQREHDVRRRYLENSLNGHGFEDARHPYSPIFLRVCTATTRSRMPPWIAVWTNGLTFRSVIPFDRRARTNAPITVP